MEFRILGPLEVARDGRSVGLGGTKQRSVLALLLLHANEAVSVDRLVDELWGEDAPPSAVQTLRVHVSRLRKSLGGGNGKGASASVLVTGPDGYRLRVAPGELDLERFERLVGQGRRALAAGDPERAAALLHEALALWRGPALADLAYEPFARAEANRLEELRIAALEERIDADLALGRHAEVVSELERLVSEHPLRERLRAQQMLALYRSGRQAEALDAYLRARRDLVEGIGVEPSAELRELHGAMLRQDPALTPPRTDSPPAPSTPERPPRRRAAWQLPAALAVVAAGLIALAFALLGDDDSAVAIAENSAGRIDPDTGAVLDPVGVGRGPSRAVAGAGSVWVANALDGTVSRIDQDSGQVTTLDVGSAPTGLAFGAGSLWVATAQSRSVSQIDPRTNKVVQTIEVGNAPGGVAVGFGSVWVATTVDGEVVEIDLRRGAAPRRIPVGAGPATLATGAGAVWVAREATGTVERIEPRSRRVVGAAGVGKGPSDIAVGGGAVWVANRRDGTVSRIDPETLGVTETMTVGGEPSAIAAGSDGVWVANGSAGTVARIDPRSRRVEQTFDVGASPSALALAAGSAWTAAAASPASHRGGTLRLASPPVDADCRCGDPVEYIGETWALTGLAYDGLVAYRRVGGAAGATLVPNLVREVPEPTDGGRTYVFQLRSGIRYSDGRPVRPEDFRHSLERMLRLRGRVIPAYFDAIIGARACVARPASCDLSQGIETDARTGTITIHLTRADRELPHGLTLPAASVVPSDTPMRFVRTPLPGTGPYRIVEYDPRRGGRLVRNPYFRVWSREARPDGFPDAIEFEIRRAHHRQVAAVTRGEADLFTVAGPFGGPLTRAAVNRLAIRHAGQVFGSPLPEIDYLFLNVRRAPFDDERARRALNYALDRRKVVELAGGSELAQLTCQFLPPGFPGYRPYCPQTLGATVAGSWNAPDMSLARRLVDASGTKGTPVEIWTWLERKSITRYVASVLTQLGYRASLRVVPDAGKYFEALNTARRRPQIGPTGWYADHLAPSNMLLPNFGCAAARDAATGANFSGFCRPAIDRLAQRALDSEAGDPQLANRLWERVDRALVRAAPAIPLFNRRSVVLVSRRVENLQWHPVWGVLLDQLWVR